MGRLLGGRYQLLHPVWRDRLGETHVARDRSTGRPVAVRILPAHHTGPAVLHRVDVDRARLTAIRHPHLAGILDLTVDPATGSGPGSAAVLAIVSEPVEGHTLRHRLRVGRPLSAAEVGRLRLGIGAGLRALHAAGLRHGDLRPDTVVLARDGRVRLTDIGLAHLVAGPAAGPAADLAALDTLLRGLAQRRWAAPLHRLFRPVTVGR